MHDISPETELQSDSYKKVYSNGSIILDFWIKLYLPLRGSYVINSQNVISSSGAIPFLWRWIYTFLVKIFFEPNWSTMGLLVDNHRKLHFPFASQCVELLLSLRLLAIISTSHHGANWLTFFRKPKKVVTFAPILSIFVTTRQIELMVVTRRQKTEKMLGGYFRNPGNPF